MQAIVINEYEDDFQFKLNFKLADYSYSEIMDIKFSSTYDKGAEKIILHAIILIK